MSPLWRRLGSGALVAPFFMVSVRYHTLAL